MNAGARPIPALTRILVAAGALFALGAGALQLLWHFRIFVARAAFPLDLEWMEGGMLLHAARLAEGKTVYVPPSLEFIPYLYTPLYPAVVAALSKVFPLGYLLARLTSVVAFTAALALLVLAAAREATGGSRLSRGLAVALGLAAAGVVAAGFAFTGTFYDLARSDALLLLLEAAALYALLVGGGARSAVFAGVAVALAFFTKQTGSVVGIALGVGLFAVSVRRALVYGLAAALTLGAGLLLLNLTSHGWFWTYVFKLHQSHGFNARLAYVDTPLRILRYAAPSFLALGAAALGLLLGGRLRRTDALIGATALAGFAAACVGFGTQWAFENAFIPAVYFPAFAAAVLGARLAVHAVTGAKVGAAAAAACVAAGLGVQCLKVGPPELRRWVPGPGDRAAAARFLGELRALDGEVFIPFHPYYNALVGKRTHTHRMGVLDVGALLGRPAGLDQAIAQQRFGAVVLDWKSQPWEWPGLEDRYHEILQLRDGVDAVRSFSGAETSPRRLLLPTREPPALPASGARVADFERGWAGWLPEGDAFGATPGPAPAGLYGRLAATSQRFGPAATGALRSPPLLIDRPRLRFTLTGPADSGLRVLLLDGPETARMAAPQGRAETVEWDVAALKGRTVTLLVEDRSAAGGVAIDEVVAY